MPCREGGDMMWPPTANSFHFTCSSKSASNDGTTYASSFSCSALNYVFSSQMFSTPPHPTPPTPEPSRHLTVTAVIADGCRSFERHGFFQEAKPEGKQGRRWSQGPHAGRRRQRTVMLGAKPAGRRWRRPPREGEGLRPQEPRHFRRRGRRC